MNYDETVSVTCTVSGGDLPINFLWMLNRAPIEPSMDILTEKRGKRISVLMIDSLKAKHAGNYTCAAENGAGSVEYNSALIVNGDLAMARLKRHACIFVCFDVRLSILTRWLFKFPRISFQSENREHSTVKSCSGKSSNWLVHRIYGPLWDGNLF